MNSGERIACNGPVLLFGTGEKTSSGATLSARKLSRAGSSYKGKDTNVSRYATARIHFGFAVVATTPWQLFTLVRYPNDSLASW